MTHLAEWVVSCRIHSKRKQLTYCYEQLNGDHISLAACTCGESISAECAIDYHRHLYNQLHPMFPLAERRKRVESESVTPGRTKHETHR